MGFTPAELGQYAARSEGQTTKQQTSKCQCASNGAAAGADSASPRSEPRLSRKAALDFKKDMQRECGTLYTWRSLRTIKAVEGK